MIMRDVEITLTCDVEVSIDKTHQYASTERIWLKGPSGQYLQLPVSVVFDIINCSPADIEDIEDSALIEARQR